ncbi:MAG: hypothetical protein IPK82_21415 [Polyangiaceae bacterium]|nr:hypothetical protein [Polyangiaceae bacterium]
MRRNHGEDLDWSFGVLLGVAALAAASLAGLAGYCFINQLPQHGTHASFGALLAVRQVHRLTQRR